MKNNLKPWLRLLKYESLRILSEYKAKRNTNYNFSLPPVRFIIGCGRSGTTILGHILSIHPDIYYLFEPHHIWYAVEPKTDLTNLYKEINAYLIMNGSHCSYEHKKRFKRLIVDVCVNNKNTIVEKTPHNAFRIGFLNELVPSAKFLHIIRDPMDVANSIAKIASENTYKIALRKNYNQWWGVNCTKWNILKEGGANAGYFPNEVKELNDDIQKGIYEWLVTLGEVDRWREMLGDNLYELKYEDLTKNPKVILSEICHFLDIRCPKDWLTNSCNVIRPAATKDRYQVIDIPQSMKDALNYYQARYGYLTSSNALIYKNKT